MELELGGQPAEFTVPPDGWPKTKEEILNEVYRKIKREVSSPLIYAGMCIHYASKRNLRKKEELFKLWEEAFLAVEKLRQEVEEG